MGYSDYIVFADESGSPNLDADRQEFPVFVLVFLVVEKSYYVDTLVPQVQRLKFNLCGHDQIVLHERDIRRQSGAFAFLQADVARRTALLDAINALIAGARLDVACAVIDKERLRTRYPDPWSPYDLALTFCMERTATFLRDKGQDQTEVHVVLEARGHKEDEMLELEFRRIAAGQPRLGRPSRAVQRLTWTPVFADKRANSTGLQLADLLARPLGLRHMRPQQKNRAAEIILKKMIFPDPKLFP